MSQFKVEQFFRSLRSKPELQIAVNKHDATAKAAEDRELSDAELEGVAGGAGEDFGRSRA